MADGRRDLHLDVQDSRSDLAASADALKFFDWAYKKGGKMAQELDYIPMPDNVIAKVEKMWATDIQQK